MPRLPFKPATNHQKFIDQSLAIGRVIHKEFTDRITVKINLNRFNERLGIFFPESGTLEVHDPENEGAVGDIVVVKKLKENRKNIETHKLQEVFIRSGFIVDPVTGRRVEGSKYLNEPKLELSEIKEKIAALRHREKFPYYQWETGKDERLWESNYLVDTTLGGNLPQSKKDYMINKKLETFGKPYKKIYK